MSVKKRVFKMVFFFCSVLLSTFPLFAQENLVDSYVNPFMGTNNNGASYSRGNEYPAVTLPFAMNAWSPATQLPSSGWFFDYKDTKINAIKATHQPSPWAGDHAGFEVFATVNNADVTHTGRQSSFTTLVMKPYEYKVQLTTYNITFDVAPTSRAASFNATYPSSGTPYFLLQGWGTYQSTIDASQRKVTGWILNGGNGNGNFYFCAVFDKAFASSNNTGCIAQITFGANPGTVNMKIGTSYISMAQAEANLNQEIGSKTFTQVVQDGKNAWNTELNKISVTGGTNDQKTIFYSSLYRGLNFPKARWELVNGTPQYMSPYDGLVHNGKIWVGNGFWDTFRAVWPFFTILYPTLTGEMLDGWVNSYKDGGWTVKWSNPGYWDCMIGTHTDSLFADAYIKGIRNFDSNTAFSASMKNAMAMNEAVGGSRGRDGLAYYIPKGYVPNDTNAQASAKTLEYSYDDFATGQFAKSLGKFAEATYLTNRSLNYTNVWSPTVGFFRGKNLNGSWRTTDSNFHPNEWGYEWIEGDAWHYMLAAIQDGQGMASLYGGRSGLEQKLDSLFAASPDYLVGSYGGVIHEMAEAYDIGQLGFGQYAHGNEPAHHLIYMYNHAGKPSKTQYWVRRAMNELYKSGLTDGYGYCGDEDNGQMSLWYVMSALGFYSVTPGFPEYEIGSPIFDSATIHLENGNSFTINAANNSSNNVYIQSATLNGSNYTKNVLQHSSILAGGTLNFAMSAQASTWGTAVQDGPTSLTPSGVAPMQLKDLTQGGTFTSSGDNASSGEGTAQAFDDNLNTKWLAFTASAWIQVRLAAPKVVTMYTLSSANDAEERDPASWTLQGSNDSSTWTTIDSRSGQDFPYRHGARVFTCNNSSAYGYYRFNFTNNSGTILQVAEIELFDPRNQGDLTTGGTVSAQYADSPAGEEIAKLVDNSISSKYLTFHASGWVQYQFGNGARNAVTRYTLTSANDSEERDPLNWTLQGSNDGASWTTVDTRSNQDFPTRYATKEYTFSNSTSYAFYRLNMSNNSGNILQLAEWHLY